MSSIIRDGDTFYGISVFGRGVFTDKYGTTYAGQCRHGYPCGLGVLTRSYGNKEYAEYGPDGQFDGRWLDRHAWDTGYYRSEDTRRHTGYCLFEQGERKASGAVFADGHCIYNGEACAPDDPRLLALIAQVAPVEVRPAATPTIAAHSPP